MTLKNPSDKTYLLIGDFAHNLRSSLDHVIYSLAVHETQKLPDSRKIQWPVLIARNDRMLSEQLAGLPAEAAAIIEGLQPYKEGPDNAYKTSLLRQLHMLDIVDKHRRIAFEQHSLDSFISGATPQSNFTFETIDDAFEIGFPVDSPPVEIRYAKNPIVRFGAADEELS